MQPSELEAVHAGQHAGGNLSGSQQPATHLLQPPRQRLPPCCCGERAGHTACQAATATYLRFGNAAAAAASTLPFPQGRPPVFATTGTPHTHNPAGRGGGRATCARSGALFRGVRLVPIRNTHVLWACLEVRVSTVELGVGAGCLHVPLTQSCLGALQGQRRGQSSTHTGTWRPVTSGQQEQVIELMKCRLLVSVIKSATAVQPCELERTKCLSAVRMATEPNSNHPPAAASTPAPATVLLW